MTTSPSSARYDDMRYNSALVGASRVDQIEDSVSALDNLEFTDQELEAIEEILAK